MSYLIRDREAGNVITECDSIGEAIATVEQFEEEDKKEGNYSNNFYEIVADPQKGELYPDKIFYEDNMTLCDFKYFLNGIIIRGELENSLEKNEMDVLLYLRKFFNSMHDCLDDDVMMTDVEKNLDSIIAMIKEGNI